MRVQVSYTVPLQVVVEVDEDGSGIVERVIVCDEMVTLLEDQDQDFVDSDSDPAARARALEIAESQEWPGWEFGW